MSDPAQIKGRGVFFFCTAFFLHISDCKPKFDGSIHDLLIFIGGDPAADLPDTGCFYKTAYTGSVYLKGTVLEAALPLSSEGAGWSPPLLREGPCGGSLRLF